MLAGTDTGTGVRGHVGVWGDSAAQPHSMGGVRGGEEGHTQEHTQERTRECCTYALATYPLRSARIKRGWRRDESAMSGDGSWCVVVP